MAAVPLGPEQVPPLKPLAYYLATDVYHRGRAVRARRRTTNEQHGVRILAYHRIATDRDVLAVRPGTLRRQLAYVLESGARFVGLRDALDLLANPVEGHHVAVTFDDGYLDTVETALPILRELGVPATVFVPTAVLDGQLGYFWYRGRQPPAMSWDDVAALRREGLMDVQSHSCTHPRLPALTEARLRDELTTSKAQIERATGEPVHTFSYPAGLYGAREVRLVEQAGYRAAVTCHNGINLGGADLLELRRDLIGWRDGVERFALKLSGALDRPASLTQLMYRRRSRPQAPETTQPLA